MSITATILLLISAFTHAGWNFISKKGHPSQAFFLVSNTIGVICVFPILFYFPSRIPLVPPSVWILVVMSGLFLAAYLAALAGAYRSGDISIAYPLARSLPVIFVFFATFILGKEHQISWLLISGIIFVVAGCVMLPLNTFGNFHLANYQNLCCFLAMLSAVSVAGYTIVDDEALRRLRQLAGTPFNPIEGTLVYMVLEGISCSLWQCVFVFFNHRERKNITGTLNALKGPAAITGIGIYLTYGFVLASMNYVTNISYVAAFRQFSIPLGAIFGMSLLKEPCHPPKMVGILIIFIGLIMVTIG
jgi:drug/metabolite transporter (DMT)-like permease